MHDALSNAVVGALIVALIGGVLAAFYFENATWLIASAVAFVIIYAG